MILDAMKIPGLSYDLLEADCRVGGRIYTHRFSDEKHDYYDVGAMRFPEIKIMEKYDSPQTLMTTRARLNDDFIQ